MVIDSIERFDSPVFWIVTVIGSDVLPTGTDPKLSDLGETEILGGGACPSNLTLTTDFFGSLEAMLIIAFFLTNGNEGVNEALI